MNMSAKYVYVIIGIIILEILLGLFLPSLRTQAMILNLLYVAVAGSFLLLLLVFPPVLSGNKYGPEPRGLDFRTMREQENKT